MSGPLYIACGSVSLGLGLAGAFLPVLPTTPFVLLAAFCFSRSHPKWHERLKNSSLFGQTIRNWQDRGAVSLRSKITAAIIMTGLAVMLWLSALAITLKALVTLIQAAVIVFLCTRPTAAY